jgi:hypothetical protein
MADTTSAREEAGTPAEGWAVHLSKEGLKGFTLKLKSALNLQRRASVDLWLEADGGGQTFMHFQTPAADIRWAATGTWPGRCRINAESCVNLMAELKDGKTAMVVSPERVLSFGMTNFRPKWIGPDEATPEMPAGMPPEEVARRNREQDIKELAAAAEKAQLRRMAAVGAAAETLQPYGMTATSLEALLASRQGRESTSRPVGDEWFARMAKAWLLLAPYGLDMQGLQEAVSNRMTELSERK